jgi:replicative DNA helicase
MSADIVPFRESAPETRAMPANLEAEQALLGALLSENSLFDFVADILSPADFFDPLHQRVYETALHEVMAGRTATPVTLKGRFAYDADMAAVGGAGYMARLTADSQGLLAPGNLARLIRDLSQRRTIAAKLQEATAACLDQNIALPAVADLVTGAVAEGPDDGLVELSGGACVEEHMRFLAQGDGGVLSGSIPVLDKLLGQLRPGQFIVCAARPGMGKTALAISYALGATRRGHGALFVSLEMSGSELGARMAANRIFGDAQQTDVPFSCINAGRMHQSQREKVGRAATDIDALPLTIADTGSLTIGRLDRLVRRQKRRFEARGAKLELVIVDYLQLLRTDQPMRSNYEAVSEISRTLKAIAKQNGVALVALAQLSREVEKRSDKRPILADLRDSGQIEQDADAVLFLLRQEYYLAQTQPPELSPKFPDWESEMDRERGRIEFILAKRRNGVTGTATGEFHGAYQAVLG